MGLSVQILIIYLFACFRFSVIIFLNFERMPSFANNKAEALKEQKKKKSSLIRV